MKYSDDIFQLIKSLSKPEKSYFKKFASSFADEESSNYLKFFNEIVRQSSNDEEYDEDKIRKLNFTGKFLKNLSFHKNYLYNLILSSITFYHRDKKNYISLNNLISQIEFLNEKSLFGQSAKVLNKAKKAAYDTDKFAELIKILNLEKKILNHTASLEDYSEKNKSITEEQEKILDLIKNNLEIYKLYIRIGKLSRQSGTGFSRNEEISESYEDIMNSEIMKDESNAKSFYSKFMYKNIKVNYHLALNDFEKANEYTEEIVKLIEANFERSSDYMHRYLISLNNLLTTNSRTSRYDEWDNIIRKMKEVGRKYPDVITSNDKIFIFYSTSIMEISKCQKLAEYEKLKILLKEVTEEMTKYELKITLQQRIIMYYFLGTSNFVISDFQNCIKWMGKIINSERSNASEDYQSHARIVYLLSYYELEYFDSLEYVLKSTYHFLSKRKRVFKYENIILKYLRRSFRITNEKELYDMFDEMQHELRKIAGDPHEKNAFDTFNILFWLESKLKKIPLTEVLKNRP